MSETYEEPLDQDELELDEKSEADLAAESDDDSDDDFEAHLFNRR